MAGTLTVKTMVRITYRPFAFLIFYLLFRMPSDKRMWSNPPTHVTQQILIAAAPLHRSARETQHSLHAELWLTLSSCFIDNGSVPTKAPLFAFFLADGAEVDACGPAWQTPQTCT